MIDEQLKGWSALNNRKKIILAELALLLCGIVWGSGFVVMKTSLDLFSINWLLAIRFFLAALLLGIAVHKTIRRANRMTVLAGLCAGAASYIGFYTQTIGLNTTTAGNNAFLTAIYVVLVPFLLWLVYKKRPGFREFAAGILCLLGVGVIALNSSFSVAIGDMWTLCGGLFFAVHIVIVSHFTAKGVNALALSCFQFFFSSVFALIGALVAEPLPNPAMLFSTDAVLSMLYLICICTLYAMVAQNVGLRYARPSHASLLMSTEAPFGCLFGILLLGEPFTARFALGALLIAGSIIWSELGHSKKAREPETAGEPEPLRDNLP